MPGGVLEDLAAAVAELRQRVDALQAQRGVKAPAGVWGEGAVPVKTAAGEWGISYRTLWRLMDSGELPWSRPPHTRERLVPRKWLRQYVEAHARG